MGELLRYLRDVEAAGEWGDVVGQISARRLSHRAAESAPVYIPASNIDTLALIAQTLKARGFTRLTVGSGDAYLTSGSGSRVPVG